MSFNYKEYRKKYYMEHPEKFVKKKSMTHDCKEIDPKWAKTNYCSLECFNSKVFNNR